MKQIFMDKTTLSMDDILSRIAYTRFKKIEANEK